MMIKETRIQVEEDLRVRTLNGLHETRRLLQDVQGRLMTNHAEIKFATRPPIGRPNATTIRGVSID